MLKPLFPLFGALSCSLLSQIPPSGPSEFYSVLGAGVQIAAVVVLCLSGFYYLRKVREPHERHIHPQPLQIKNVGDLATINQLDQVEQQVEKRFDRIDQRFEDVFKKIDHEGKRLDGRMNSLSEKLSEFIGRFDQSQRKHHPNDR